MFCDEALDAVEAIASGDLTPEGRVAEHFTSCRQCAAALDSARRLDRLLRGRDAPRPPTNFTSRTMARIRRSRWRSDQFLDVGFNLALGLIILGVGGVAWVLLNSLGLSSVSGDALNLFGTGLVTLVRRVAPSLPLYAGATAVVATALGIWWWAERDVTL
jgi:predicted anti-sigma-YlaC factor YlaD